MTISLAELDAVIATSNPTLPNISANNPYICIPFDAIATAITWDTPVTNNLEPWLAGIIQVLANYNAAQIIIASQTHNIVISKATGYSVLTRNSVLKKLNRYSCDVYTSDTGTELPDGDFFS